MDKSVPHKTTKPPRGDPAAVVLTGGSSGIGRALLELIQKISPKTVLCNLSRSEFLPSEKGSAGRPVAHFSTDLTDREALSVSVKKVLKYLEAEKPQGPVWLVNNSGFGSYGPFAEQNVERQGRMVDLNVRAVVELTGAFLPLLREHGGVVLTVASTAAFQPVPQMAVYGATKSFVLHWSLALDEELRGSGVRSLCVCPGPTRTEFFRSAGFTERPEVPGPSMSAEAVAQRMWAGARRGRRVIVPGWSNRLLISSGALLPKTLQARLAGMIMKRLRLEL
jgi:uncharacterized protein